MTGLSRRSILAGALGLSACATAPEGAASHVTLTEYHLGPGDQLRITVFGEETLTGQYVVSQQGVIAFPLVGDVPAQGLTVQQTTARLTELLGRNYLREPNVSIEVLNYRPFFILGEVRTPGTYPYSANLTVMNAVATAGGFSYRANSHRVRIKHAGENVEHDYVLDSSTPVQPGDTIRIPERRF
jgi:polysaccharide export outer membrane protein